MSINDRKRAQEAKFALDTDTAFRVRARRNRLLGDWAADLNGVTGEEAAAYARDLVQFGVANTDEALAEHLTQALGDKAAGINVQAQIDTMATEALRQIQTEQK